MLFFTKEQAGHAYKRHAYKKHVHFYLQKFMLCA